MGIYEHEAEFGGKPVIEFRPDMVLTPDTHNYRIRREYDDTVEFTELFALFVSSDGADQVTGLITGGFSDEMYEEGMGPVIESIIASAEQLQSLTSLFIGDIVGEENEISWIIQSDVSPIWQAFPRLRILQLRGGQSLSLGEVAHDQLQALTIQTGGLPARVVREVGSGQLPQLEHLELWLGDNGYGGDSTIDDVKPLLDPKRFPKLKYLGLKNSEYSDAIAQAIAESDILSQLEILDLSMGTLSDEGAKALIAQADKMTSLKHLDIDHHYVKDEVLKQLSALPFEVTCGDRGDEDEYDGEVHRYIAVSE